MANTGLATANFWEDQNKKYELKIASQSDPVVRFFENDLPWHQLKSCFEVGCFPGGYLGYFGTKGLELNGIDISEKVETHLAPFYHSQHFKTGFLQEGDFFSPKLPAGFDVVCSFGFIEHFENWKEVMDKHISLLNKNGYLIITTPNFSGRFQRFFHWHFDRENYLRHYIPCMNPELWKAHLEERGLKVIKAGYFGKFNFWVEQSPGTVKKLIIAVMVRLKPLAALFISNHSKSFSPYCGIIATL